MSHGTAMQAKLCLCGVPAASLALELDEGFDFEHPISAYPLVPVSVQGPTPRKQNLPHFSHLCKKFPIVIASAKLACFSFTPAR